MWPQQSGRRKRKKGKHKVYIFINWYLNSTYFYTLICKERSQDGISFSSFIYQSLQLGTSLFQMNHTEKPSHTSCGCLIWGKILLLVLNLVCGQVWMETLPCGFD